MLSYWEKQSFTSFDTIIIGAGLSGLFTALFLRRKYPNEKILVVGQGTISDAASTKNAGFACLGSVTELDDDLQTNTVENIVELVTKRYEGLQIMRHELGDQSIAYHENGSFELLQAKGNQLEERIDFWNRNLAHLGIPFAQAKVSEMPFNGYAAAIKNNLEGEIDTGRMYRRLKRKALDLGIELYTNTTVARVEYDEVIKKIWLTDDVTLNAKRVVFCTNAFTKQLLPQYGISPARAQVIITRPIDNIPFKGIYHFDRGYYYFREINGRVLFGGGRQLDINGERTAEFGNTKLILDDLSQKLKENILPNHQFEIDYSWSGIMGVHNSKVPIVKELARGAFVLAGLGGMGVALAPRLAQELVENI